MGGDYHDLKRGIPFFAINKTDRQNKPKMCGVKHS